MSPLQTAFEPEHFRAQGHRLVDQLADRLAQSLAGIGPVLPVASPDEEFAHWSRRMAAGPQSTADFLGEFAARSIQLHHPRFVGHQVCPPAPEAALAGLAAELLNNGMAVYEMGPAATALERWIVQRTAQAFGFAQGDGFLTSGGTLGNLTALLAARSRWLALHPPDDPARVRFTVLGSAEAHYCISRAVEVMGGTPLHYVPIATDDRYRMRPELLDECYDLARGRGLTPIAVVGSACTTSTGSYDDLAAIADFAERRGLWFHVDGAHGAAVAFCPELRDRLAGIERADSVVLDFHKLMLTPALATGVIFQTSQRSWGAFEQRAAYLWDEAARGEWFNVGRRSFECTKLSMSVKIAALWQAHGEALFAENLRTVHGLARTFAALLRERPPFEVAVEPQSNIVCFRYQRPGLVAESLDELNATLRREVLRGGRFYLVQTVLRGRTWLRTALMNPFTTPAHLSELLDEIERLAAIEFGQ